MNKHKSWSFKWRSSYITTFISSASPCKGGHMPTMHIWRLPSTDFGLSGQSCISSHLQSGFLMEQRLHTQHFWLLCNTVDSISMLKWQQDLCVCVFVCVCVCSVLAKGLSTDPGRTCWSQGWSSRSLDHPSGCRNQSSSRRTGPPAAPTWSSALHSNLQSCLWRTSNNLRPAGHTHTIRTADSFNS